MVGPTFQKGDLFFENLYLSLVFHATYGFMLFLYRLRQTTIRERTQTVEKLSVSEAETGRLHVDLAAARAAAEKNKVRPGLYL